MLTGVIVSLVAVLLLVFLLVYKKEMIIKMFMLNVSAPANEFSQQLEQTADSIIRRLEDESAQLELLLEEAEAKIGILSQQVEYANKIIEQLMELENRPNSDNYRQESRTESVSHVPEPTPAMELAPPADDIAELLDDNKLDKEPVNIEKHRLIIAMADQGYTITEIAKATGVGKGEITLLLQLNKK
ncbi:conserved hypothetical protein [uncultured Sporomusa sp.]|uniref:Uncharacterized protein n=1 Tax=uncultured Sporomusa sp. TaxID=307249 RepID=A0A212LS89_9FIRM|nr:hypothetical protein [uncultured Sporomusa sp.]SCM80433.1 conserved hypothetical protein [uncultured Sporomusa sp.]